MHFLTHGYISLECEPLIYIKHDTTNDSIIIILVYVDDLQIICNNPHNLDTAKAELKVRFKMMDLGEVHHILGLCIIQTPTTTSIDQAHYIQGILKKTQIDECTPVNTSMETSI